MYDHHDCEQLEAFIINTISNHILNISEDFEARQKLTILGRIYGIVFIMTLLDINIVSLNPLSHYKTSSF